MGEKTDFHGNRNLEALSHIPQEKQKEHLRRALELGLEAAPSVVDRTISLFARGYDPAFAGINTFLKMPYCEDARAVGDYEAAFLGIPFDGGTTFRPGARWGPQGVRRISALYDGYSIDNAVDLHEELDLCDLGDVFVIPANLEKTFDQVSRAVSHVVAAGVFPILCGGDHSLGFPNVRGIAPHIEGNVGIIHIDRHLDTTEKQMDERMHGTPWYWTVAEPKSTAHREHAHMHDVGLPNCRPENFVQIGIGGWAGMRDSVPHTIRRGTRVLTIEDVEELGARKVAEIALDLAWKGAKAVYLSFDIDSVDPAYAPGTGTPEPGGLVPREALEMVRTIAAEGLCGLEVVEIAPPYDVNDNTSQLGCRVILDALAAMVKNGKLGHRDRVQRQS